MAYIGCLVAVGKVIKPQVPHNIDLYIQIDRIDMVSNACGVHTAYK